MKKKVNDRSHLLLNDNFAGLINNIKLKQGSGYQIGRILTDKGYKEAKYEKKEYALHAFTKE